MPPLSTTEEHLIPPSTTLDEVVEAGIELCLAEHMT